MGASAGPALAISTGVGAVAGFAEQRAASRSARRSAASVRDAAETEFRQAEDAAALERIKTRRLRRRAEGRLAVTAAEAGVGTGETFAALQRSLDADASLNEQIIGLNLDSRRRAIESGASARLAQIDSTVPNLGLSVLRGGLQGFNTGLSILQTGELLDRLNQPRTGPDAITYDVLGVPVPERPEF